MHGLWLKDAQQISSVHKIVPWSCKSRWNNRNKYKNIKVSHNNWSLMHNMSNYLIQRFSLISPYRCDKTLITNYVVICISSASVTATWAQHSLIYSIYCTPGKNYNVFFSSLCSVLSSLAETDSIHYSSYHNLLPSHNEYKTYAGRKNKIINGALPPVRAFYQPKVLSSFSGSFSTNTHKDQYKYIQYEKNRITACFSELWSHTHITQISGMTEPYYYIHES